MKFACIKTSVQKVHCRYMQIAHKFNAEYNA